MTYNTGNPIGSTDPRDLIDNAETLDFLVNSETPATATARLGRLNKNWALIEQEAQLEITAATEAADQAQAFAEAAQLSAEAAQDAAESIIDGGYQKALSSGDIPRYTDGRTLYRYREKMAMLEVGQQSLVRVALIGSSTHENTPVPQAFFDTYFNKFSKRGQGWVGIKSVNDSAAPPDDVQMTRSGWEEWDAGGQNGGVSPYPLGPDGQCMYTSLSSSSIELRGSFTDATIYCGGVAGAFRYRVDGGAWVTVNQVADGLLGKVTITGLVFAYHLIEIDTSPNTGVVNICGFRLQDNRDTSGVELFRMGNGGLDNTELSSVIPWIGGAAADFPPDIIIFTLGTDDARNSSSSIDGFKLNVAAYLAKWKELSPNAGIICVGPFKNGSTIDVIPLEEYVNAMYLVALEGGYEFINMYDSFAEYAVGNEIGLYSDALRLSDLGARVYVDQIETAFGLLDSEKHSWPDMGVEHISNPTNKPAIIDLRGGRSIVSFDNEGVVAFSQEDGQSAIEIDGSSGAININYNLKTKNQIITGITEGVARNHIITAQKEGFSIGNYDQLIGFDDIGLKLVVSGLNAGPTYLYRKNGGLLAVDIEKESHDGKPDYIGEDYFRPRGVYKGIKPVSSYINKGVRLINFAPGIICLPTGRWWCGYGGDHAFQSEKSTNYLILKYSDDQGESWVEFGNVDMTASAIRAIQPHFYHNPLNDVLDVFIFCDGSGLNPDPKQSWSQPILNPSGDKPFFGRPWLVTPYGVPSFPFFVDGRLHIMGEVSSTWYSDPNVYGSTIFELDTVRRTADKVGKLPDTQYTTAWPENSIIQLADGSFMASQRSNSDGYKFCYGEDLQTWGEWGSGPTGLGDTTSSRVCMAVSPNGNRMIAYNNSTSRRNMVLGLLSNDGAEITSKLVIDPEIIAAGSSLTITTTYPSISFNWDGKIVIAFDFGRVTYGQIWLAVVDEDDFLANGESASVDWVVVDKAFDYSV